MKHYPPESHQGRQALRGFCSAKLNTLAFCSKIDLVISFSWCPIIWCYWGGTYRYLSYYYGETILHTQLSIFLQANWAYDYTMTWFGTKLSKKMRWSEKCKTTNNDKSLLWLVAQYVIIRWLLWLYKRSKISLTSKRNVLPHYLGGDFKGIKTDASAIDIRAQVQQKNYVSQVRPDPGSNTWPRPVEYGLQMPDLDPLHLYFYPGSTKILTNENFSASNVLICFM